MLFFKPFKSDKDVNVAYEIFAELVSSRLGLYMGFPLLELKIGEKNERKGFFMEYLSEKADENVNNIDDLKSALAFEEVILNIDLKEEHVLAKDGKGYIIDHGHSFLAWKPLYYIHQLIDKKVARFNLWSDTDSFLNGVEKIKSIDDREVKEIIRYTAEDVYSMNYCKLFTEKYKEEAIDLSFRIFNYRRSILTRLF
ncbi:hypothetical protein DFR86_02875 [Acidianus sulfidivorans JP7]|uniref:Uncharacterized protein n=1 Tax=Acidianus sulfidivorans JP7 TaxID=619593 RepID=A0A2U9IKS2_9CREN|nr:hypothetical protein [Acidianus sulfidivorans]AWR96596.1 hypothetical protein DFR86_02875 [Acidianus sulfidivorans JP7]